MRFLYAAILFLHLASPARAADIAIALTDEVVDVDASFAGAKIVLFGAVTGVNADPQTQPPGDIVAVVRGPAANFRMRPMLRNRMIWTPGPGVRVIGAPGLLLTISTRPLEEFTTAALRQTLQLDANALDFAPLIEAGGPRSAAIIAARGTEALGVAFLDIATTAGLFQELDGAVSFKKGSLFAINVELPPTTPLGDYVVDVYFIRDGALISRDSARPAVRKVGLERGIHEIAHERPIAYGIGCVAISIAAGWLAAAAFRKSS